MLDPRARIGDAWKHREMSRGQCSAGTGTSKPRWVDVAPAQVLIANLQLARLLSLQKRNLPGPPDPRRSFGPISTLCQHHHHKRPFITSLDVPCKHSTNTTSCQHQHIAMWSLGRQLLVGSLAVWSAAAELSFSAQSIHADGEVRALSNKDFNPVPPRQRWQHTAHRHNATWKETRDLVSYSGSWCGASQHSTKGEKIVNAYGSFTTPYLKLRDGLPAPQYAAAWVGIDGAECKKALLQAGVTTVVGRLAMAGGKESC